LLHNALHVICSFGGKLGLVKNRLIRYPNSHFETRSIPASSGISQLGTSVVIHLTQIEMAS